MGIFLEETTKIEGPPQDSPGETVFTAPQMERGKNRKTKEVQTMKKRKSLTALALCLLVSLGTLAGCGGQQTPTPAQSGEGETEWNGKVITLQPASWQENGFWAKHIELFAEYVNEHAEGRVVVHPTAPGSIVPTDQAMASVSDGVLPAMAVASAYVAGSIDLGYVFSTPPVVQSIGDMRELNETYQGGRAGQLWEELVESTSNVHVVGEMYGPANVPIVSTIPIRGVADLKSATIRVGAGSIADSLVKLGASTDYSAATEVYTMLSTGAIDAAVMGSPSDDLSSSYNEVTKYWIREPYVNTTHCTTFVVNRDVWNSMTAADRQILVDAIAYSNAEIEREGYQIIDEAWNTVESQGIELIRWSEEDAQTWAQTFYDTCAAYSQNPAYVEYMELLHSWAVEKGYLSES